MAAFPGRNRSVLRLDNAKTENSWSGWEAELGKSCGSGVGMGLGWGWNGIGMGQGAGNAHGARPCSWHCFGLCSAPPGLLLSSGGCRGIDAVPVPGPLSRRGAPACGEGEDEGAHPIPTNPSCSGAGQCCDPTATAVPVGSREGWGSGAPPASAAVCLLWINGNQIVQPGKSLEANSCCWSPSRSAELLHWVCLGGKRDVGRNLGSLKLANCNDNAAAAGSGELLPESSPRIRVEGKILGRV